MRERLERISRSILFRSFFAALCIAVHLWAATTMGKARFNVTWNVAPGEPPAYAHPESDRDAAHWNRLVVSRWDSGQYIGLALRGYQYCPAGSLRGGALSSSRDTCRLSFFPGYSLLGRVASVGGRIPIDYALLGVSLLATFVLVLLWTSQSITARLGTGGAYLSLLLFNAFTTGFTLVTIQTEPTFLALTFGSFVALDRRMTTLGAFVAGAATAIRVTGAATGFAFGLALLVATIREPPRTRARWVLRGLELLLPGWGLFALFAYYKVRFDDPLVYFHSHAQSFNHGVGLSSNPALLLRAIDLPLHEGLWLLVTFIFFFVGRREAMKRFDVVGKTFFYALFASSVGISVLGSFQLQLAGMNRYLLHAIPLFFAMAAVMRRRVALLGIWLAFSVWHYWQVDLCLYTSGPGDVALQQCNDEHWIGKM